MFKTLKALFGRKPTKVTRPRTTARLSLNALEAREVPAVLVTDVVFTTPPPRVLPAVQTNVALPAVQTKLQPPPLKLPAGFVSILLPALQPNRDKLGVSP